MRRIDADALVKVFEKQRRYSKKEIEWCIDRAIENINEAPTIDPCEGCQWLEPR